MAEHLYLDAPSLVYRAFFALPKTITDPKGNSVNAVRGFMDMVATLLTQRRPASMVAVFDADWRPAFRVEAYAGYKADRPADPPELPRQFDVLAEVLDAAGIPRTEAPGLEADDAVATLLAGAEGPDRHLVVTGDRDLLCLVEDPVIGLLFTVRGVKDLHEFDEAAVTGQYGVQPRLYPDFATLRGDPSDGLPGVAGVGPMRAAKLLNEYGSIDGVLGHLDDLPPRQAAAFEAARAYLDAMKVVVPLVRDAKMSRTGAHAPDEDALARLREEHALGGSIGRLVRALDTVP